VEEEIDHIERAFTGHFFYLDSAIQKRRMDMAWDDVHLIGLPRQRRQCVARPENLFGSLRLAVRWFVSPSHLAWCDSYRPT
jgi:hypothetical protein